jgi:hypothetical protein
VDISKRLIILFFLLISSTSFCQNINSFKQVTIQGFRCDSHNDNYFYIYSDYLVDQALRLRSLGTGAFWTPPFINNKNYYILNINEKIFLGGLEKEIYLFKYGSKILKYLKYK